MKKSFYSHTPTRNKCKHPFVRKTSFGQFYCPNCEKNIDKNLTSDKKQ